MRPEKSNHGINECAGAIAFSHRILGAIAEKRTGRSLGFQKLQAFTPNRCVILIFSNLHTSIVTIDRCMGSSHLFFSSVALVGPSSCGRAARTSEDRDQTDGRTDGTVAPKAALSYPLDLAETRWTPAPLLPQSVFRIWHILVHRLTGFVPRPV